MSLSRILVVGAGAPLGFDIARQLRAKGCAVTASYRTSRPGLVEAIEGLGATPIQLDLSDKTSTANALRNVDSVVFTPILTVSMNVAALIQNTTNRVIFFSSYNVMIDPAAPVYAKLLDAEKSLLSQLPRAVILRPTMIYGHKHDGNLSRLMRAMKRWRVALLAGAGRALQQPIYYRDLAAITTRLATMEHAPYGPIPVAGPEAVSQRALYLAVAKAARARPLIAPAPLGAFASVAALGEALRVKFPVSAAQLKRAGADKAPKGEPALLRGPTPLEDGLAALAASLDEPPYGA